MNNKPEFTNLPKTAEGRMRRSRIKLLMNFPEVGKASLPLHLVEDLSITSVATDGESLFYNPDWVMMTKSDTVNVAIAHVTLHIMLDHYGKEDADKAVAEAINQAIEKDYLVRLVLGDQYPVKVQSVDQHIRWNEKKMKRPLNFQPATWDGDPKDLLDKGKLPTELAHANFAQIMDFCSKVIQEILSDQNENMKRIENLLKFILSDILQKEMSILLIRDIVRVSIFRTQVLSLPLWIDWSMKNKEYLI